MMASAITRLAAPCPIGDLDEHSVRVAVGRYDDVHVALALRPTTCRPHAPAVLGYIVVAALSHIPSHRAPVDGLSSNELRQRLPAGRGALDSSSNAQAAHRHDHRASRLVIAAGRNPWSKVNGDRDPLPPRGSRHDTAAIVGRQATFTAWSHAGCGALSSSASSSESFSSETTHRRLRGS